VKSGSSLSNLRKGHGGASNNKARSGAPAHQENPWPGRLNIKRRLSPIFNNNDGSNTNLEGAQQVKGRDGRGRKVHPISERVESRDGSNKVPSTVPVLPKITECDNASLEDRRRANTSSIDSCDSNPSRSEATDGTTTSSAGSKENNVNNNAHQLVSSRGRLVRIEECNDDQIGRAKRRSTDLDGTRSADRITGRSVAPLVPIIETESKWLRKQHQALDDDHHSPSNDTTWDTRPKNDKHRRDRDTDSISSDIFKIEQELKSAERVATNMERRAVNKQGKDDGHSVDMVMPFEPGDVGDSSESEEEAGSSRTKRTMYREIGTVFREYFDDDDETPDSSHGDSFFQRRKYWVV
jgi:hypothetical protein